jgi:hypothetical protein
MLLSGMLPLMKNLLCLLLNDDDVKVKNQIVEIDSKDQPNSSHVQVEPPSVTQNDEEDELDHNEVQRENTHILQQ